MKYFILFISLLLIVFLIGCSQRIVVKKGVTIDTIGICLSYQNSQRISYNQYFDMSNEFDSTLKVFINNYNKEKSSIKFSECIDKTKSSLNIDIIDNTLISPSRQAIAVTLSVIGLAVVPITLLATDSPIIFAFADIPENKTSTYVHLSYDISGNNTLVLERVFNSNPFFGSLESQKGTHADAFYNFLNKLAREIRSSNAKLNK